MIDTILIVDDDFDNRELIQDLLGSINVDYVTAASGQEAIDLANQYVPDVVLLDMSLGGGLNGLEVAQSLRQTSALDGVFIIGITADVFRFPKHLVINSGCDVYLPKPFSFKTLRKMIVDLQNGEHP